MKNHWSERQKPDDFPCDDEYFYSLVRYILVRGIALGSDDHAFIGLTTSSGNSTSGC